VIWLLAVLGASPARAQSSDDAATAQALFDAAKKAMEAGDFETACPKFAESQRISPGTGTLTGLALCHEKQGKTASAWAEFLDVATKAQRANQAERASFAKQHASDLEPKLSKLTITVDPDTAKLAGLAVKRDDQPVRSATWGVALPVDPGKHTIEATANGKQKWTTEIEVGDQADSKSVSVGPLEDDTTGGGGDKTETKTDDSTTEKAAETPAGDSSKRTIGLVVGGVGVAGIALASYFGIDAISKSSQAKNTCNGGTTCSDPNAQSTMSDAKTSALISDLGFGIGIAAVGVGAYLFFTSNSGGQSSQPANSDPAASPSSSGGSSTSKNVFRVMPLVGPQGGGAAVVGTF
jgi:serine/threonine-protein kinase